MASTPVPSSFIPVIATIGSTPKTAPPPDRGIHTPARSISYPGLQLQLRKILGLTIPATNGFDSNPNGSTFAMCAGPAAVVTQLENDGSTTQKIFRAPPDALPPRKTANSFESPASTITDSPSVIASRSKGNSHRTRPNQFHLPDQSGKSNVRQRTRATACVALSPDGRFLAVGETGYNPRILIFSRAFESSDPLLACVSEHTSGVRCIAFSQDSQWLCSVGDLFDGFIYIWTINNKTGNVKLHSSNKCTSTVYGISWLGSSVISVGTRHVKVWRVDQTIQKSPMKSRFRSESAEPGSPSISSLKTLAGRNVLLGDLLEATFTCVTAISDTRAMLSTDRGQLCVLDDGEGNQRLSQVLSVDFGIKCSAFDRQAGQLWVGGCGTNIHAFPLNDLVHECKPSTPTGLWRNRPQETRRTSVPGTTSLVALGCLTDRLIAIDTAHTIWMFDHEKSVMVLETNSEIRQIPAHGGAVMGVDVIWQPNEWESDFFSWSSDGTVIFWSIDGTCTTVQNVVLEQSSLQDEEDMNGLKVVRASSHGNFLVSGDKVGSLRLIEKESWDDQIPVNGHFGEINDVAIVRKKDGTCFVASCGRDRTTQIFTVQDLSLNLLQTLEQHASSVNEVIFADYGEMLFSSSSDRTIVISALAATDVSSAYVAIRTIMLKASPTCMTITNTDTAFLYVCSMDKQLLKYEIASGRQIGCARLTENSNNEAVVLSSVAALKLERIDTRLALLVGGVTSDKTLRVFDAESGLTLGKEFAHSEGISNVAIIARGNDENNFVFTVISAGLDGVIMLWDLNYSPAAQSEQITWARAFKDTGAYTQPLRRILSKSVLSDYQRALESKVVSPAPATDATPRIHKRPSKHSLASPSAKAGKDRLPLQLDFAIRRSRFCRSDSPPSPSSLAMDRNQSLLNERHRRKSASNLNDLSTTAEQLCEYLRAYRQKLAKSSSIKIQTKVRELERELKLTLKVISEDSDDRHLVNDTILNGLLDTYSEKLTRLVEEKVAIGITRLEPNGTATETRTNLDETNIMMSHNNKD